MNEYKPTEADRSAVVALSSFGTTQEDIAMYIGITSKTLRRHYRVELDTSLIKTNMAVAKSLFRNATENDSVPAQIFWLKTKGGFKESQQIDHISTDGSMTPERTLSERLTGGSKK